MENYITKKGIRLNNMLKFSTLAVNKVYRKLFLLSLSVFMLDKEMFLKLVRKDSEEESEFFDEASQIYLGLVNQKRDFASVEEFARKIFENDQVASQLLFYLEFHFYEHEKELF